MSLESEYGHIFQDGIPINEKPAQAGKDAGKIYFPVLGVVTAVYYVDDPENGEGSGVVCDVNCQDMGIFLFRVPFLLDKASVDNYIYMTPRGATKNVDKSEFNSQRIDALVSDGDVAMIVFANGSVDHPYIIKTVPHFQSGYDKNKANGKPIVNPSPFPKRADGEMLKVRMNGTNFIIDKDGNIKYENTNTVDEKIPKKKKFFIQLNEKNKDGTEKKQRCEMEIDNTGEGKFCIRVKKEDEKLNEFCIDVANNKVEIVNTNGTGVQKITMDDNGLNMDVKGDITQTATGNLVLNVVDQTFNISGKYTVTSTGDMKFESSAKLDIKSTSAMSITSDAKATFAGSGGTDVGDAGSITNVQGNVVKLAGGGAPVARLGDMAVGTGNLGAPVISNIAQGSPKVTSG